MRTVLITGVSTGIGKSIAEELLQNNFYVIGSVRKQDDANFLSEKFPDKFSGLLNECMYYYKEMEQYKINNE